MEFIQSLAKTEYDLGGGFKVKVDLSVSEPNDTFDNFDDVWDDLMEGRDQADSFGLFSSLLDPHLLPDIEQVLEMDHPLMKTMFTFPQQPRTMNEAIREIPLVEKKALYDNFNNYKTKVRALVEKSKNRLAAQGYFEKEKSELLTLKEIKYMEKKHGSDAEDILYDENEERDSNDEYKEFQKIQREYLLTWKEIKKLREPPKSASKLYKTFFQTVVKPEDKMAYEFFGYKPPNMRGFQEEFLKDIYEETKYDDAELARSDQTKETATMDDKRHPNLNIFYKKILDVKTHSHQTKGGRRSNYSALIIMGNRQGTAGWGYGHGPDALIAMEKAKQACSRNLVTIDLLESRTLSASITAKYMRTRITLRPLPRESGIRGSRLFKEFFDAIGFKDISGDSFGARNCKRHILQALFNAIQVPILPDVKAKMLGKIVFDRNRVWHKNPVVYSF
jgi:small subunit ribosomal protein S5